MSVGNPPQFPISYINNVTDSEQDIENLIERTGQVAATTESLTSESGLKFDFAKIWEPTRGSLEEVTEDSTQMQGDDDFWAKILEQSKRKEDEAKEKMGRGVRRKAAAAVTSVSPLFSLISLSNPRFLVVHKVTAGYGSFDKETS